MPDSDFKPLPRKRKTAARSNPPVGAETPSSARRHRRSRDDASAAADAPPRRRSAHPPPRNRFGWLKYVTLGMMVGIGIFVIANMQSPPPVAPPPDFTPDPEATLAPTREPFFAMPHFFEAPTDTPTPIPTPSVPDVAIVAGHWAMEGAARIPDVPDSGAICPDGTREVDITKSVADKTIALLRRKGYRVELLQEFDPVYKDVNPDFAPRSFL